MIKIHIQTAGVELQWRYISLGNISKHHQIIIDNVVDTEYKRLYMSPTILNLKQVSSDQRIILNLKQVSTISASCSTVWTYTILVPHHSSKLCLRCYIKRQTPNADNCTYIRFYYRLTFGHGVMEYGSLHITCSVTV